MNPVGSGGGSDMIYHRRHRIVRPWPKPYSMLTHRRSRWRVALNLLAAAILVAALLVSVWLAACQPRPW